MKKILGLLLFILFHSLHCIGQISNVVDLKLPAGAERQKAEKIKTFSTGNSKIAAPKDNTVFYVVDGVQIGFLDLRFRQPFQVSLENKMTEMKSVIAGKGINKNVKGAIRTFNGIRFIILSYDNPNDSFIRFYSEYHNEQIISGVLEFSATDNEKADNVLNEVLNTMVFKN